MRRRAVKIKHTPSASMLLSVEKTASLSISRISPDTGTRSKRRGRQDRTNIKSIVLVSDISLKLNLPVNISFIILKNSRNISQIVL